MEIIEDVLRHRHNLSSSFHFFHYAWRDSKMEGGAQVSYLELIGVECPLLLSGKMKGTPNWRKKNKATEQTFNVTRAEMEKIGEEWRQRTGKCVSCAGLGRNLQSSSSSGERTYRQCGACEGSGWDSAFPEKRIEAEFGVDQSVQGVLW